MEKKKIIATGIILLFIGVTITPTLNHRVVTAFTDDGLVEVTTQACGIPRYGNTTVKLTREQSTELDCLFDTLNRDLRNASSRQEAARILQDAVKELYSYGVLPAGMAVEQTQKHIIRENQKYYEKIPLRQQEIPQKNINAFCFLTLTATRNSGAYPFLGLYGPLFLIMIILEQAFYNRGGFNLFHYLFPMFIFLTYLNPLRFSNIVQIEGYNTDVHSFGIKGFVDSDDVSIVLGFTGLMLYSGKEKIYFVGSALALR